MHASFNARVIRFKQIRNELRNFNVSRNIQIHENVFNITPVVTWIQKDKNIQSS